MKMVGGDNVFALARSCLGLRRRCGGGLPERWTGLWVWLGWRECQRRFRACLGRAWI